MSWDREGRPFRAPEYTGLEKYAPLGPRKQMIQEQILGTCGAENGSIFTLTSPTSRVTLQETFLWVLNENLPTV
jgi:hypothetical protein